MVKFPKTIKETEEIVKDTIAGKLWYTTGRRLLDVKTDEEWLELKRVFYDKNLTEADKIYLSYRRLVEQNEEHQQND